MSTEAIEVEAEINPVETDDNPGDNPAESASNPAETGDNPGEADEIIVTIGDEPAPEETSKAPEWVRELRKTNRELARQNRELQARLVPQQTTALAAMPKLEEFDYDADKYQEAMLGWVEKKKAHDDQQAQQAQRQQKIQHQWETQVESYKRQKAELKVDDYDDAEEATQSTLSNTQQAIIVQGANNPALIVYALGKNPTKAKDLAAIDDPVKFAFAIAKLENELKVTSRKTSTAPPAERTITGTARISGTVDSQLDRLRAEAEKTGNYTKVMAYKRQLAAKK